MIERARLVEQLEPLEYYNDNIGTGVGNLGKKSLVSNKEKELKEKKDALSSELAELEDFMGFLDGLNCDPFGSRLWRSATRKFAVTSNPDIEKIAGIMRYHYPCKGEITVDDNLPPYSLDPEGINDKA
jgi:hypothetical protein